MPQMGPINWLEFLVTFMVYYMLVLIVCLNLVSYYMCFDMGLLINEVKSKKIDFNKDSSKLNKLEEDKDFMLKLNKMSCGW